MKIAAFMLALAASSTLAAAEDGTGLLRANKKERHLQDAAACMKVEFIVTNLTGREMPSNPAKYKWVIDNEYLSVSNSCLTGSPIIYRTLGPTRWQACIPLSNYSAMFSGDHVKVTVDGAVVFDGPGDYSTVHFGIQCPPRPNALEEAYAVDRVNRKIT